MSKQFIPFNQYLENAIYRIQTSVSGPEQKEEELSLLGNLAVFNKVLGNRLTVCFGVYESLGKIYGVLVELGNVSYNNGNKFAPIFGLGRSEGESIKRVLDTLVECIENRSEIRVVNLGGKETRGIYLGIENGELVFRDNAGRKVVFEEIDNETMRQCFPGKEMPTKAYPEIPARHTGKRDYRGDDLKL